MSLAAGTDSSATAGRALLRQPTRGWGGTGPGTPTSACSAGPLEGHSAKALGGPREAPERSTSGGRNAAQISGFQRGRGLMPRGLR